MRALILAVLFAPVALTAQQGPPSAVFPEVQGPPANYMGYAYVDCSASNTPIVRVVALQGLVPEGVPKSAPRPSIELVINSSLDAAIGKQLTVAPKAAAAAGNAQVSSCPVVGDCAAADTGVLTVTGKAENG